MNDYLQTVIIAPMTSVIRKYPSRVNCTFQKIKGQVALDQLRAADKSRLKKLQGSIDDSTAEKVCEVLTAMFEF
jgi:mRNA interferase MazF